MHITNYPIPSIVVSGGLAYDVINVYPKLFHDQILKGNIKKINVSYTVERQTRSEGGTGGNIAFNLASLGENLTLISAIGRDGGLYLDRLQKIGVNTEYVYRDLERESANCYLGTDFSNNQINFYYPGPTDMAMNISIADARGEANLAIISPSTKDVMLNHLKQCAVLNMEVIFDPGQQTASFGSEDMKMAVKLSDYIFCNDYEIRLMVNRSGWKVEDILAIDKTIVTTHGKDGSFMENSRIGRIDVQACKGIKVEDPTGAGDALRAGFIVGHMRNYKPAVCLQIGNVAASFAIEKKGTQKHRFDPNDFMERYETNYGEFPRSLEVEWKTAFV